MPPRGIVECIIAISFIIWYLCFYRREEQARPKKMEIIAKEMGFSFYPKPDEKSLFSELSGFTLFSHRFLRRVKNLMKGETDGGQVSVFDYQYGTFRRRRIWTVVCFQSDKLNLSKFTLQAKSALDKSLWGHIDFDLYPEFSKCYLLSGAAETAIRNLFHPNIIKFFEKNKGLHLEGDGNYLILHKRKKLSPKKFRCY